MKKQKNKLDEMQEQKLLKIEHNGCWLAFWGLLASFLIQVLIYGTEAEEKILGEWIVFICLAAYIVVDCFRQGIWDRRMSPTPKVNFIYSLIAGIIVGVFCFLINWRNNQGLEYAIKEGVSKMIFSFVLIFVSLSLLAFWHLKRKDKVENEEERSSDSERNE